MPVNTRTSGSTTYTARNRRIIDPDEQLPTLRSRFPQAEIKAAPGVAAVPPRPLGELSAASIDEICATLSPDVLGIGLDGCRNLVTGIRRFLTYLATHPGQTWQERWQAAGLDGPETLPARQLPFLTASYMREQTTGAIKTLFAMRVIQPSLIGLRANKFAEYADRFRQLQRDPLLDRYFDQVDRHDGISYVHRNRAKFDVAVALTVQGINFADLTPAALLYYAIEARDSGLNPGAPGNTAVFAGRMAWRILHEMGHFPPGTPATLRAFINTGQRTTEELVDLHEVKNQAVRQLLIDYLARRRPSVDYNTLVNLARTLAGTFWATVERLNPEQADLALSPDLYAQWVAEINYTGQGDKRRRRTDPHSNLLAVRGLYVDLHSWAVEEPERWGPWATTCPIPPEHLKGFGKRRRAVNARMADRTRLRQPLLPQLVAHVESRHEHLAGLLAVASAKELGEDFEHQGRRYRRCNGVLDRRRAARDDKPHVRVEVEATGEQIHLTNAEDIAFWEWACVEILRHTGIRIEEFVELTHASVRQYQRPNGEVIALLVIAPSKSDRERVIPMSAETFHVVAQIIRRQTRNGTRPIPLVSRYDVAEAVWSAPMPFLVQRENGPSHTVISTSGLLNMLHRTCDELAAVNPAFAGVVFTPHDFRRLFATEIVNGGLPIHIGAALLGHLNLQTTQGYVAVFPEDVVHHYQAFLDHRRSLRPETEYADVTPEEWTDFEEHFDKRKVELGNCSRPYGTPCQHEHACVRCPMLQVNPKMIPRLNELEKDLLIRLCRAQEEQWLGEIEGIELTLKFLRSKRAEAERAATRGPVDLGLPAIPSVPRLSGNGGQPPSH